MTAKHFMAAAILALLPSYPVKGQNASDLLQKGLHLQEAAGDVDGAIVFFRQVVSSAASSNRTLAAQAQYQIVLCMLQKGDRVAAEKELARLENEFSGVPDLIAKARKLIPGSSALLASPWGEVESAQLNIQRDGAETGEYLYYSATAWSASVTQQTRQQEAANLERSPVPPGYSDIRRALYLRWALKTKSSRRSIELIVDRDTLQILSPTRPGSNEFRPVYHSDDDLGDLQAAPFVGPATDVEQSVFLLRRLPLSVGYKTSIPVTSNSITPAQMELTVTGIESVQTVAGKFNCYKVSFPGIGQTFWVGVEGARPLVKFQSGNVAAHLVKIWGAENVMAPVAEIAKAAGATFSEPVVEGGGIVKASIYFPNQRGIPVTVHKIYTPRADIEQALKSALELKTGEHHINPVNDYRVRPGSLQHRTIGGKPALTCLLDYLWGNLDTPDATPNRQLTAYVTWIATEDEVIEFRATNDRADVGTFRFRFEPMLAALRLP